MTFNFDDDDLWSPMRNQREWERQLRDGERRPTFDESLEPLRQVQSNLIAAIKEEIIPLIVLLTRLVKWIDAKINR